MSLDLTLIPYGIKVKDITLGPTTFRVQQIYEFVETLYEDLHLIGKKVPEDFWTPMCNADDRNDGEKYSGNTQVDAHDEQLRSVKVERLLAFKDHPNVKVSPWNKAIWAFLAELPPIQHMIETQQPIGVDENLPPLQPKENQFFGIVEERAKRRKAA